LSLSEPNSIPAASTLNDRTVRIGVLVSGTGSNLQSIIDNVESGHVSASIRCVISNRKDALALTRAVRHGIPAIHLDNRDFPDRESFDTATVAILREYDVNLVVLAGFNRILSSVMLDAFPMSIINIHPALLPAFPGKNAQLQALRYGVKIAGCTVHFVDAGTDTGPIIAQAAVPVLDSDDEETLSKRILVEEHKLYPAVLKLYAEGRLRVSGRRVHIYGTGEVINGSIKNPPS
jgi:phosphoribosylglycinamide formyltransferase 1